MKLPLLVNITQLPSFREIIDVRTPAEFEEDHIPGAINCPVLSNEERITIGTMYKNVSPFAAKKLGAALVSQNISNHLRQTFINNEKDWRPLIYCWRGGKRSSAMTHVLREIGWEAQQLEGGYKTYRREVMAQLQTLPQRFSYRVICGETGSGKSKLLQAIAQVGGQVLDLEQLAAHRGSVLGDLPTQPQPTQKMFESLLLHTLRQFDPLHPVYVEAESKKIGALRVPDNLMQKMWASSCIKLNIDRETRVQFLIEEYHHFLNRPEMLKEKLSYLKPFYGAAKIEFWNKLTELAQWPELVQDLLQSHYDPAYLKSTSKHYQHLANARILSSNDFVSDIYIQLAKASLK